MIKDPRTNVEHGFDDAFGRHYYDSVTRDELCSIIQRRIPYLRAVDLTDFIPPGTRRLISPSTFVNHVLELYKEIDELIQVVFQHIQNLDRRSGNAQAVQITVTLRTLHSNATNVNPSTNNNDESSTNSEDSLEAAVQRPPISFGSQTLASHRNSESSTSS